MSWWDSLFDFAVQNPTVTGAVVGGLAGGAKGAVKGAATGYALGNLYGASGAYEPPSVSSFFGGSSSGGAASGGSNWAPVSDATPTPVSQINAPRFSPVDVSAGAAAPVSTQSAITGNFGGLNGFEGYDGMGAGSTGAASAADLKGFEGYDGMGAGSARTPAASSTGGSDVGSTVKNGMAKVSAWGKENPEAASMLIKGGMALLGNGRSKQASAMQDAAYQRLMTNNAKNDALADTNNARSSQLYDQAMSTFSPQSQAISAMAGMQGRTNRAVKDIETNAMKRGMSATTAAAEKRRAKVQGAADAVSAYSTGYESGQRMQNSALGTARQFQTPYGGSGYDPDLARDTALSGADESRALTDMLEYALGDPSATLKRRRATQNGEMVKRRRATQNGEMVKP